MNVFAGLLMVFFLYSSQTAARQRVVQPQLEHGEIDLNHWNEQDATIIHGEWLVVPDQSIDASNYKTFDLPALMQNPQSVRQESSALFLETSLPNFAGFRAAYLMLVKNPTPRSLALRFDGYKGDFETSIYVPDTDFFYKLDSYGDVRLHKPLSRDYSTPSRFYNLDTLGMMGRDFYVIVNSRAALVNGKNTLGISHIRMASSAIIASEEVGKRIEQFVLLGVYAMLMFYSLAIFLLRREDHSSLTVAILSLMLALRYLSTERLYFLSPGLYDLTIANTALIRFTYAMATYASVIFVYQKFRPYFSRRFFLISLGVVSFSMVDLLGYLISNVALSLFGNLVFMLVFSLLVLPYLIYVGWKARDSGGIYASSALFLFSITMFNDFYYAVSGQLESLWLGHYGMISLAIGFALVNARVFANTFKTAVQLNDSLTYFNKNLEGIVKEKTGKITALLDHIPQGVLSLEQGGIIAQDYSRHLVDIIDVGTIAGNSFKALVLDRSQLSADKRDQAWQTLLVVIGESDMNFEANADKLPTELAYRTRIGLKWLKLTWNVEVQDELVQRVLVTMLDVTKEKALEKEAEDQRHEFEILRELIEAGARKIGQYFVSATALLKENERILEKSQTELDHPDIQCLFINMHTVKGGARTLGLKDLARVFHEVEEYYQDILRNGSPIRKEKLQADLRSAFAVYGHYQVANRSKLGRSDDYSKVVINREFVEEHYQILRDIVADLDKREQPLEAIIERIHSQKETIIRLIFDQLPAVFDEYKYKTEKIAREVNKPRPQMDFRLDPISVTPEIKSTLDNCMVHLLRNALSHGIEAPEERLKLQKSEAGTITIRSQVQDQMLNLEISDDGRGLAIEHLRKKGLELGSLPSAATVQEIAELIFAAGVSTAATVTPISGRGVGMDAVRKFLEQQGGGIEIRLGNPKDESRQYYNFKFLIHIPLQKPQVLSLVKPLTA